MKSFPPSVRLILIRSALLCVALLTLGHAIGSHPSGPMHIPVPVVR